MCSRLLTILLLCINLSLYAQFEYSSQPGKVIVPYSATNFVDEWEVSIKHIPFEANPEQKITQQIKRQLEQAHLPVLPNNISKSQKTQLVSPPVVSTNFGAYPSNGIPNDNNIAISDSGIIVAAQNTALRIFNESGTYFGVQTLNSIGGYSSFSTSYDPKILYDPVANRFILVFLTGYTWQNTKINVCFSKTSNPTNGWWVYKLDGNPLNDSTWSDYPSIAMSDSELFVCVNTFYNGSVNNSGFKQSTIWQINKIKGYTGAPFGTNDTKYYYNIKYMGTPLFNITPIKGGISTYGDSIYFLSNKAHTANNDSLMFLLKINTTIPNSPVLSMQLCTDVLPYTLPPNAPQKNDTIKLNTNDCRVLDGFYHNQEIHFVMNARQMPANRSAVLYGRIKNLNTTRNIEEIFIPDTLHNAYPSICFAGLTPTEKSVFIAFNHSGDSVFAGCSAVFVDDAMQSSYPVRIKMGTSRMRQLGSQPERWGDYTGIQRKYNQIGVAWAACSRAIINGSVGRPEAWVAKLSHPLLSSMSDNCFPSITQTTLDLSIFPNPVHSQMTVSWEHPYTEMAYIHIFDVQGKKVATLYQDYIKAGRNVLYFNTTALPNGVYILTVQTNSRTYSSKLVVQP
ncbi:MAG: T9SS type A sorting domain-containing protein [Bacteroidia bacterium]|nr:T9SS type A sorting domain-containing protein [Bacteroidia bacterium]MDW8301324.1 T9SS type A sorting domain-containing protein [Bacteroidia bacterium]